MVDSGIKGVLLTRQPTSKNNIGRTVALARREPTSEPSLTIHEPPNGCRRRRPRRRYGQDDRRRLCGPHPSWNRARGPAIELAKKVDSSKNLKLIGLMGYSGGASHTKGWNKRKKKSQDDLAGLLESVAMARAAGLPVGIVTGGSTGTYNIDSESKGLDRLQAGSSCSWTRSTGRSVVNRSQRFTVTSALR